MNPNKRTFLVWAGLLLLLKILMAVWLPLGVAEARCWAHAVYPDWSYFDHPPMLSWILQVFNPRAQLVHPFFLRIPAILISGAMAWFLFIFFTRRGMPKTGFYSGLVYLGSVYFSLVAGTMITPASVALLFWLPALMLAVHIFVFPPRQVPFSLVALFAILLALAFLSHYSAFFLWVGTGLYVTVCRRKWLVNWRWYTGFALFVLCIYPLIHGYRSTDFLSLAFHLGKLDQGLEALHWGAIWEFLAIQCLYQSPVIFALIVLSLWKRSNTLPANWRRFWILSSLPLLFFAIATASLPGSLPAWSSLTLLPYLLIAGGHLSALSLSAQQKWGFSIMAMLLITAIMAIGTTQLGWGSFQKPDVAPCETGRDDATLEWFGWAQVREKAGQWLHDQMNGQPVTLISNCGKYSAHFDFYLAHPGKHRLLVWGTLENQREYFRINGRQEPLQTGEDAFFITTSLHFHDPERAISTRFQSLGPPVTIPVLRMKDPVYYVFIYPLRKYNGGI